MNHISFNNHTYLPPSKLDSVVFSQFQFQVRFDPELSLQAMIDGMNLKPGTSSQETDDDEMPPLIAFDDDQTKEQGPEQEQGTTVAERMAAHYREQEEKFESHIKAREKEYKARIEVMDEMKKAFQVQEQGPEQEQGTTVAERMEAHYKEQEEKFYKNELRKKVADLRRIKEHEENILKHNEEFVARIEAMRQSHINYIEKEYKARIEVMDEMKKAFQVRRDGEGSDSRSSGSA